MCGNVCMCVYEKYCVNVCECVFVCVHICVCVCVCVHVRLYVCIQSEEECANMSVIRVKCVLVYLYVSY